MTSRAARRRCWDHLLNNLYTLVSTASSDPLLLFTVTNGPSGLSCSPSILGTVPSAVYRQNFVQWAQLFTVNTWPCGICCYTKVFMPLRIAFAISLVEISALSNNNKHLKIIFCCMACSHYKQFTKINFLFFWPGQEIYFILLCCTNECWRKRWASACVSCVVFVNCSENDLTFAFSCFPRPASCFV